MSEWKEYKLSELAEIIPGYAFKGKDFGLIGNPVVKIGDINPPIVDIENCLRIPTEKLVGLDKFKLIKGDFVVAMTGATLGKVGRYSSEKISFINQRVAKFENKPGLSDKKFLYYLITSREVTNEIINRGLGSAQPNISARDIESINVVAPNLYTQSSIAEILSSLDDKIDNNNKINQELDSLAQLLFKRWFEDFEFPNENGEPYKSSGGEMVDSELGEIPKGWKVATIGDVTELITKGTTPTTVGGSFTDSGINYIKVESLTEQGTFNKSKFGYINEQTNQLLKRSIIKEGDVLFSIVGTIGRIAVVTKDVLPANTNQNIAILRPNGVDGNFLRLLMKSSLIQNDTKANVNQAVQANLNLGVLKSPKFIRPTNEMLTLFNNTLFNTFRKIESLTRECELLINLRDTLFPKLISGELQINDN
jgi:type I restriction enzyme S subunit